MKVKGSVLIVVLGLLAILAVVGITFVTMSSIDRNTAANFALQSQFDLAAEGAVEFACHALVQDLWGLGSNREYTSKLMSDQNNNEPFDAPGTDDPWLANTVEPATAGTTPKNLSFGGRAVTLYTLPFRGTATSIAGIVDAPDNLGTGVAGAKNGIWLPELAFPYEGGLMRASITIQDHASLINLNAHGTPPTDANDPMNPNKWDSPVSWPLADMTGWGYFISDVDAGFDKKVNLKRLLIGDASRPGRWGPIKGAPGNPNIGEILFENPAAAVPWNWDGNPANHATDGDYPLTLDEEFDLRRIPKDTDPKFPSRVAYPADPSKAIFGSYLSDPRLRLAYTTVGWTSEARGDWNCAGHLTATQGNSTEGAWSARKADLNFDDVRAIYQAMAYGRTCPINAETAWGGQFAANVAGFRDGSTGCGIKGYDLGSVLKAVAASRQPIFSKVVVESGPTSSGATPPTYSWTVKVQVVSPWPNDNALEASNAGLTVSGMALEATVQNGATCDRVNIPGPRLQGPPTNWVGTLNITGANNSVLASVLTSIQLTYTPSGGSGKITLDQIGDTDIGLITGGIYRPIFTELEWRGASDPSPVTVLYVGPWKDGLNGDISTFAQEANKSKTSGIPIRFPRSVDGSGSNLPPRAPAALKPFKAIARLGDIDQILCPNTDPAVAGNKGSGDFWPWVPRVAKATANNLTSEANEKFNWDDTDHVQPDGTKVNRINAANVLAVSGPWKDLMDNDGDGKMDNLDAGTGSTAADLGRFAGPELRVAGKVNLNTATSATLQAMESGLRLPQGCLSNLAATNPRRIFRSIAEIRSYMNLTLTDNPNARGLLEQRDEAFNRISNIASVRSDTYSIYGTVQYGTIVKSGGKNTFNLLRSRRFWALVDRSPSLAYSPTENFLIHPRIMNFQWMN